MKKKLLLYVAVLASSLTSCVDTVEPTNYILPEQVEAMSSSQEAMLNGIVGFVNAYNTLAGDEYYLNDWGYPCQMMYREVQGADFPVSGGAYNYWGHIEASSSLRSTSNYTYYYYYRFVLNCNALIKAIDLQTASEQSRHYLGCALAFRALCYLDLARTFEYQLTGVDYLDNLAQTNPNVMGLTVPIVDENITDEQLTQNPRAPFYTMYRFILNDLNKAEACLDGYVRPNGNFPDQSVVYGLKARLWLEMATRFGRSDEDLATMLAHEADADGYASLGIASALDCYAKAADYAHRAQSGYTPTTRQEWTDPKTGFNTATAGWMLYSSITTKEQQGNYYSSLMGSICTEASWSMSQYGGGNYRCISSWLYNAIDDADWRKLSWIAPSDAGHAPSAKYQAADPDKFKDYPAYANLKWRARDISDGGMIEGMKCDIPMMRVEEMILIEAEAVAYTQGVAAGGALLEKFLNTYRYTRSYHCDQTELSGLLTELMTQRRIEFWGEGITFFDYKRLRLAVYRSGSSNYPDNHRHDSKAGYVCPTMNYYMPTAEMNVNTVVLANPDPTRWYDK